MSLLSLRDVSRTYRDGQPVYALRSTTLDIAQGEYVSITGPSGSGKSTLLNVLGLLDEPTTGSYRVGEVETVGGGQSLHGAIRGQVFGFVFQFGQLVPELPAVENVALPLMLDGQPRSTALSAAASSSLISASLSPSQARLRSSVQLPSGAR